MMEIKIFEFNPVGENTFVLYDETKECVIIDAGAFDEEENRIMFDFISKNNLVVKHLLNTHLHFDHVFGNLTASERFNLSPQAHKADEFLLDAMPAQLRMFGFPDMGLPPSIGKCLKDNDIIEFGNQKLEVLEVPGHSPGSVAFYNKEAGVVIVGDALFRGSIGRTDLAGGNHSQLLNSISSKLFVLPADTKVYPGHGPATTIGEEIQHNPFFR